LYGADNLVDGEDWLMQDRVLSGDVEAVGVRIITAAPEVGGVMESISELNKRNILFSIGHRSVHVSYGDKIPIFTLLVL
jgi:N-acetylglucosamine-6-phosphate deacetylase